MHPHVLFCSLNLLYPKTKCFKIKVLGHCSTTTHMNKPCTHILAEEHLLELPDWLITHLYVLALVTHKTGVEAGIDDPEILVH